MILQFKGEKSKGDRSYPSKLQARLTYSIWFCLGCINRDNTGAIYFGHANGSRIRFLAGLLGTAAGEEEEAQNSC